jgi:hypothetical protein
MTKKILLYYSKTNTISLIDDTQIIQEMYMNLAMIPTIEQLKTYKNIKKLLQINLNLSDVSVTTDVTLTKYIKFMKNYISKLNHVIPLYDHQTKNIYLVLHDEIYNKITNLNYRFCDTYVIKLLQQTLDELTDVNAEWIKEYVHKINKNLNFLSNFDLNILKQTMTEAFINTNPSSRELTTCIKSSYLPYQNYQSPYYTKSELISMGLNLKIIEDSTKKPWTYSDNTLKKICKKLANYEINTRMLIYNQLYILYNNAKAYVQYYSLFGSYYFNTYLRKKSVKDVELDIHINNFLKLIESAPEFDSAYEVYRFIESDDYLLNLKINDIFEERSFISTTRNPFYSMTDNKFGFILLKIKLKSNVPGIGLLLESYSNYPAEQEILLPPSKLKLVEMSDDFKYYHWNKLAEKKIIKKYVFEYVEPISYDISYYTSTYIDSISNSSIPDIDFYSMSFDTNINVNEKILNFFNSLPTINLRRAFFSNIGQTKYKFFAYFLTQNPVYSKFFFLQKEHHEQNRMLGDQIYFTIQNTTNGQIELLVEMRNIISVNYYHRFSGLSNTINDKDLIHWLSGLAKAFGIFSVVIHGNYSSYAHIVENILNSNLKEQEEQTIKLNQQNLFENFKTVQHIDNPDSNILNLYTSDINTYCVDLVNYILFNDKRFNNLAYVEKQIPFHMIDKLHTILFIDLYNKYKSVPDDDLLYRIYSKTKLNLTVLEFYKYLHQNFPYMVVKLQNLIVSLYPKTINPPWHFYYILKPFEYLFESNIIPFIPQPNVEKIDQYIKNLKNEISFINENKFRQIKQQNL